MAYFTMPDTLALLGVLGTLSVGIIKFTPSKPKPNGNGKTSISKDELQDIKVGMQDIKTELKDKQDTKMCDQIRIMVEGKHEDLKQWTSEISTQNKTLSTDVAQIKTDLAVVVTGIKALQERREKER